MIIKATQDIFGHIEFFTADDFRHIFDLIDGYMKGTPYTIQEIEQDDITDRLGRIDIQIRYNNEQGYLMEKKLLILNDELIDGKTFHERYDEWYGHERRYMG